eukprot:365895-Chlamydomonas_euryale.AAC.11
MHEWCGCHVSMSHLQARIVAQHVDRVQHGPVSVRKAFVSQQEVQLCAARKMCGGVQDTRCEMHTMRRM